MLHIRTFAGLVLGLWLSIFGLFLLWAGEPARAQSRRTAAAQPADPGTWKASGKHGAVAAGGQGAVDAGLTILQNGGNAADAAVATILALSVTDSGAFCFGGEVPIMVYDAKRKVVEVLCGLGTAPRLATREHFAKS
jgi:gamma-glutamyltranspeptidase